jgi:AcrR family transcriptional regulator
VLSHISTLTRNGRIIKSTDLGLCHTGDVGKRQDARERIEARIIELGRRQLVTEGAAGLSLRAIARDLGMVSSAVYRYVANRDELLTLLVTDAYTELADAVDTARNAGSGTWRDDVLTTAHAMRRWALDHPAVWALLYGSPVPGYHAPAERTTGPGTRVMGTLLACVADGVVAGDVRTSAPAGGQPDFDQIRHEFGFPGDDAVLAKCFLVWAGIIGAISMEVFGGYGPDALHAPEALFNTQVELLTDVLAKLSVDATNLN